MKKRLEELAEIQIGYTVRKLPKGTTPIRYPMLQIKNVAEDGDINLEDLSSVETPGVPEDQFLKADDVLFCARGSRHTAGVFKGGREELIAGSQVFVLRTKTSAIIPDYLAWFVNQSLTQKRLKSKQSGTYIKTVTKGALAELVVPVPPLDLQKSIVETSKLALRERALAKELQKRKLEHIQAFCMKLVLENAKDEKGTDDE